LSASSRPWSPAWWTRPSSRNAISHQIVLRGAPTGIELADVSRWMSFALSLASSERYLSAWPSSKRVYLPNGVPAGPAAFSPADLARTLRNMAEVEKKSLAAGATRAKAMEAVRDYFYRGDIARRIANSRRPTADCCATKTCGLPRGAGRSGLHHLPRLHRLQARFLEPGRA